MKVRSHELSHVFNYFRLKKKVDYLCHKLIDILSDVELPTGKCV